MKFLIVEPSPLPILIPLGPKYSPQQIDGGYYPKFDSMIEDITTDYDDRITEEAEAHEQNCIPEEVKDWKERWKE